MVRDEIEFKIDGIIIDSNEILNITFDDKDGIKSDKISLKVIPAFKRPAPNSKAELTFRRYLKNKLIEELYCGLFHTQATTRTDNKALSFTCTAVEFNETQKKKLSHHYMDTKLSNIVEVVGKRLNHIVKFDTPDLMIKSLNQTNETDINFLNRLAKDYNSTFSIKNDFIFFVNKDNDLPVRDINIDLCKPTTLKRSTRKYYKGCNVTWHDIDKGKSITLNICEGTPVLEVKGTYKTNEEARIKAKAELYDKNKGIVQGSFSSGGIKIYAGTKINIINTYDNEDDGVYSVESCRHSFTRTSGWTVDVEIEN